MGDSYEEFKTAVQALVNEMEGYEKRSSKAASKRVRKAIGEVKKLATPARKALLTRDRNM